MKTDKVILFDVYQTLVDTDIDEGNRKEKEARAWNNFSKALKEFGVDVSSTELVELIGEKRANFYEGKDKKIYHHNFYNIIVQILKEDFGVELSQEEICSLIYGYRKIIRGYVNLYPGVTETLTQLTQKYKLAIASYTQGCYTNMDLEDLGIRKLFSYFIYTSDIGFQKTSTKFYERCLEITGREARNCIMIGDNYDADVLTPQKLGIKTIWVKNPLTAFQYSHLIDKELKDMIELKDFTKLPKLIKQVFVG